MSLTDPTSQNQCTVTRDEDGNAIGKITGVNRKLINRLKRGEIPPRRSLDLHGLTQKEAHRDVRAFLRQSRLDGENCVLIITGKGINSPVGAGVLKEAVPHWISQSPNVNHILGFCPALPAHGGSGALYVLLRKFP